MDVAGAGVGKEWTMTWNMNNELNWKNWRLPCKGQEALFPATLSHPAFLKGDMTLGSLTLPLHGSILLGEGSRLRLDPHIPETCLGGSAEEARSWVDDNLPSHWYDPLAWKDSKYDPLSSPVPDVHRVPCLADSVRLPSSSEALYRIKFTPPAVTVNSFIIGNQTYTTSSLVTFAQTPEGRERLEGSSGPNSALAYIDSYTPCLDITGCPCGTEGLAFKKICEIAKKKCPKPNCAKPIKPVGFCCPACVADVTIDHKGTLSLADLRNLVEAFVSSAATKSEVGTASAYVAKMQDGLMHVFLKGARGHAMDYTALAELLMKKLKEDIVNKGGSISTVLTSGYAVAASAWTRGGGSISKGAIVAIIFLLCIVVAAAAVYVFKRRRPLDNMITFSFRRLSLDRRISVVDVLGRRASTASSNMTTPCTFTRETHGLRFHNPIFNQSMASLAALPATPEAVDDYEVDENKDAECERENPMYTAYEKMSPEEKEKADEQLKARDRIMSAAAGLAAAAEEMSAAAVSLKKDDQIIPPQRTEVYIELAGKETDDSQPSGTENADKDCRSSLQSLEDVAETTEEQEPSDDPLGLMKAFDIGSAKSKSNAEENLLPGLGDDETLLTDIGGHGDIGDTFEDITSFPEPLTDAKLEAISETLEEAEEKPFEVPSQVEPSSNYSSSSDSDEDLNMSSMGGIEPHEFGFN
ncbi:amnion associated transmembrane protein isoform X2 [Oratosquilla oratoria]